ncbi:MAG: 23S rRNA (adenine(2503)-C(2))-methyltransferase RlmN [Planctomycetota bacterium]
MTPTKPALTDWSIGQFGDLTQLPGAPSFVGASVRRWVLQRAVVDFAQMTDLSKELRSTLDRDYRVTRTTIVEHRQEHDGTHCLVLGLDDDDTIETVLIPDAERLTLCLSTQVGCPVACVFCASGAFGLKRQLSSGEIVEQVLHARRVLGERPLTNIVVMGIGEPLLNLDNLLRALEVINHADGVRIGARRITVSTVGFPDRIRRLAELGHQFNLAISLHAPTDELRRDLIPHGGQATIEELIAAARMYQDMTGREVTFEYVLLHDLNDRLAHARMLGQLLAGFPCTVNLIPLNPVAFLPYRTPPEAVCRAFREELRRHGLKVTQRRPRGRGIAAACGQLRLAVAKRMG